MPGVYRSQRQASDPVELEGPTVENMSVLHLQQQRECFVKPQTGMTRTKPLPAVLNSSYKLLKRQEKVWNHILCPHRNSKQSWVYKLNNRNGLLLDEQEMYRWRYSTVTSVLPHQCVCAIEQAHFVVYNVLTWWRPEVDVWCLPLWPSLFSDIRVLHWTWADRVS